MEVVGLILGPTLTSCVITIPTLFACFFGFDIPTSFMFIGNVFLLFLYKYGSTK